MRPSLVSPLRGIAALRDRRRGFALFAQIHALRGNRAAVEEALEDLAHVDRELAQFRAKVVDIELARKGFSQ